MKKMISECIKFRSLIYELVSRDIKTRYRRSVLGLLWTMLTPILSMLVMTIVFSKFFRFEIENYVIYLLLGNIIFTFFSDASTSALWSIVDNSGLIKKVYVPKCLFPITKVLSNVVNLFFATMSLFIVMLVTRTPFHWTMFLLGIPMLYLIIFTIGLGMILSTYTVFFRDISHLYSVITLLWMYITPIFYPVSILEDNVPFLLVVNPLFHYIDYCRELVLYGNIPGINENLTCLVSGNLFLLIGIWAMNKKEKNFILYI